MPDWSTRDIQAFTRRGALQVGVGCAVALATRASLRSALAESTSTASPMAATDYSEPGMLIEADRVTGPQSDPLPTLVAFMPAEDFAIGHIAGSVHLDWPTFEVIDTSDTSIARWRERTSQLLASLGISCERPVIAYDAGTLFAARLWWILHYLGHEDTYVLNGGLASWKQTTGKVNIGATPDVAMVDTTVRSFDPQPRSGALAQLDEVLGSLDDPGVAIIDARTPEEYADGHIPGAININYPRNARDESPKFWRPADELRAMYEEAGITPDKRIIPYCSTGVRSAVTFFTLRLIGYQDVGLYTGSWKEWGGRTDTPKTEGDRP